MGEGIHVNSVGEAWEVRRLWEYVSGLSVVSDWEVPEGLLDGWPWGEETPYYHLLRVFEVDMSYPILVCGGEVVDGNHRLVRALASGERVCVREIEKMPECDFIIGELFDGREGLYTLREMVEIVRDVMESPLLLLRLYGEGDI